MRGTFKKACVSRGNRNEDTGDSHKGSTTDSCGHTITQPVSVRGCVFWERKINFHFLGCNSCFFFLLYTFCLAFFLKKKIKQTNKSLFSVRVNPTIHECIQIINWPGKQLFTGSRKKTKAQGSRSNNERLPASRTIYLSWWARRKGVWVHRCEHKCVREHSYVPGCGCKGGRAPCTPGPPFSLVPMDSYWRRIFFKLTHFLLHLAKQRDS